MAQSKEALTAAANAMPCLCEMPMEGQHTTPCPKVYAPEVAAAMVAYATERHSCVNEMARERDAALARAEAAEGLIAETRRANEAAIDNGLALDMKLHAAEERVRVLEAAGQAVLEQYGPATEDGKWRRLAKPITALRDALAKEGM